MASMRGQEKHSHMDLLSGMSTRGEKRGETKRRDERREREDVRSDTCVAERVELVGTQMRS